MLDLIRKVRAEVRVEIREWRERWNNGLQSLSRPFPDGPPYPAGTPCYYCGLREKHGPEVCGVCIHSEHSFPEVSE